MPAPAPPPATSSNCTTGTYLFCEDFEGINAGTASNSARWSLDMGGAMVTVETSRARDTKALHLHLTQGSHAFVMPPNFAPPNNSFFGRMWAWVSSFPIAFSGGHYVMVMAYANGNGDGTTVYPISGIFMPKPDNLTQWGVGAYGGATGDWTVNSPSSPTVAGKWTCLEWEIRATDNVVNVWIDGVAKPDMSVSTKNHGGSKADLVFPKFNRLGIGWGNYHNDTLPALTDVWIDDIALATTRVGCGN